MFPDVIAVTPGPGHSLHLTFANGERHRFDLTPYLRYPVFQPLRDPARFGLARVAYGTFLWPGGIDIAPETLYVQGVPETRQSGAGG